MTFAELGLHTAFASRCASLEFIEPTPIQRQAIPVILSGSDLIGCAATGTGKTAAFLLPMLQRLSVKPSDGVRALILAPTRELASQIAENLRTLDAKKKATSVIIVGGASMNKQRAALRRGVTIVVATPGRLLDHLESGTIDLSRVETLVLDEADRMLDMGFLPAIRSIIKWLPSERQTLLFSATMPPPIEQIAREYMRRPKVVEVNPRNKAAVTVKQTAYPVATESKTTLLLHLLEREQCLRALIFTRTRRGAERLSLALAASGSRVDRIHADRSQSQREAALRGFKDGRCHVLVATDIAARGIDVDLVTHVINFDVPATAEDYVHRIGRTGRAGNAGQAITLLTPVDELSMLEIEKLTGQKVERVVLPGFGGITLSAKPPRSLIRRGGFRSRRFGR
ncbi:MAG TPA: DEAD/DEAH box helicase [Blastocatellia bacterium]|jgi:ATP-dependent RNA helicase RhlE|nr:DEAD/DEAH box helicase [Blastocatellia bacterium]